MGDLRPQRALDKTPRQRVCHGMPDSHRSLPTAPTSPRAWPWTSPGAVLLAIALCLGVGIGVAGGLRHIQHPERFPLLSIEDPAASLATYNPGVSVFATWWSWRGISTGDMLPIVIAARDQARDEGKPMYRPQELLDHRAAFVYTPFSALLLAPFVPPEADVDAVLDKISIANHLLAILGVSALYLIVFGGLVSWRASAVFVLTALAFYPLAKALELTQAGVWIFVSLAVSALALQRSADGLAGLALAIGVSIKPHLIAIPVLLIFAPGFPRRVLVSCFIGVFLTTSAAIAYAGWNNCMDYLTDLIPTLSNSYAYFPNQSFQGLLLRVFTDQDPDVFNLAQPVPWIRRVATGISLMLLLATLFIVRRSSSAPDRERALLSFGALVAAATLASPICWLHHLLVMAIPLAIATKCLLRGRYSSQLSWVLLVCAVAMSLYFETGSFQHGLAPLLTGISLYGGLGVLAVMWKLCATLPRGARLEVRSELS